MAIFGQAVFYMGSESNYCQKWQYLDKLSSIWEANQIIAKNGKSLSQIIGNNGQAVFYIGSESNYCQKWQKFESNYCQKWQYLDKLCPLYRT